MESLLKASRVLLTSRRLSFLPIFGLVLVGLNTGATLQAQFPGRGDDVTPSLGQFNVVVDPHFERVIMSIPDYKPFLTNKGGHLNFTSPVLFDPTTTIGRSDPLSAGSADDTAGVLSGNLAPHVLQDGLFTVRPSFAEGPDGTREVHTFIESLHLTGSGFEVKAGNQAPLRPISAGEVESLSGSGDPARDFPANSFFDVFVEVDVALGRSPKVQLVNVDPLLVQNESITSFPPRVLYVHGNSSAVPLYFYADIPVIGIHRGDLFGQLTLAGHGVGFTKADVPEFEAAETEAERQRGRLPLQDNPIPHVDIVDEVPPCIGDCDGDGHVSVDELINGASIVLGRQPVNACHAFANSQEMVDIAQLIKGVHNALNGCGG